MKKQCLLLSVVAALAALFCPSMVLATPILGVDLASFTVLGAETVTNVPTSTIVGNVGVTPGAALPGFSWVSSTATADSQVTGGSVHSNTALAQSAQAQLTTARLNLDSLGVGTTLTSGNLTLAGTLAPGVYTVPYAITNLSGALTLDGGGNANAGWVFQMESSLITSSNSVVNVINTGSGAGVFWNVRSSATIDTNTTFLGNILALTSISMNSTATDLCGRALADTGAVTLIQNSLAGVCRGDLAGNSSGLADSYGLSGGFDVTTTNGTSTVAFLPFVAVGSPVPEPGTLLLVGAGLVGLVAFRKKLRKS